MKETKFEELMQSYASSLGQSRKRSLPRKPPVARRLVFFGGMAVALGAVFLFWPKDAAAQAMERMAQSIKNAKSMEVIFETVAPSSRVGTVQTILYENHKWRLLSRQNHLLAATYIVNGGRTLTEYKHLDHAILTPKPTDFYIDATGEGVDALEFAKQNLDSGAVSEERTATIKESKDGKAYTLRLVRKESFYVCEILVDKATDLPIRAEVEVDYSMAEGSVRNRFRQTYRFNHDIPDDLFELKSTKPIIDLQQEQKKLAKEWGKPVAEFKETEILDARITPDGTIWIVTSAKAGAGAFVPSSLDAGNGVQYGRSNEIAASAILGDKHAFMIGEDEVTIHPFTPVHPVPNNPSSVNLKMAARVTRPSPNNHLLEPGTEEPDRISVPTRVEHSSLPSYFPAFDLDYLSFQMPQTLASTRAQTLEDDGKWEEAARAHERVAEAQAEFIRLSGFRGLREAKRCYLKVGLKSEADRVQREIDRILAERRK